MSANPRTDCPRCKGTSKNPDDSVLGYPGNPCYYCHGSGTRPGAECPKCGTYQYRIGDGGKLEHFCDPGFLNGLSATAPIEAQEAKKTCPTCSKNNSMIWDDEDRCISCARDRVLAPHPEAQIVTGMHITEAKALLMRDHDFKAAYEAPDPEWDAEKAKVDAKIPHPEATQGDELYERPKPCACDEEGPCKLHGDLWERWHSNTATRMAVEAREAYEAKIQDLAVETYVHSKVAEWAESYKHPGDDQNPYLGLEGAGYASAQEHVLGLLPKWRDEALQAQLKEEPKS